MFSPAALALAAGLGIMPIQSTLAASASVTREPAVAALSARVRLAESARDVGDDRVPAEETQTAANDAQATTRVGHEKAAEDEGDSRAQACGRQPTPPPSGMHALVRGFLLDVKALPSRPNLYIAVAGGVAAIAAHPLDGSVNSRLRSQYDVVDDMFAPAKYYGGTVVQLGLSLGAYGFGRTFDKPRVSHLGMDLLRAQALGALMVEPLKLATRRQRPDGSNFRSFPSGHSAATFAGATVLERHLGWKKAAVAYGVAAYVATSRLHDNVHYLSDVVMGAAVGTIAGRTVTVHGRDAWSMTPMAVPAGVGVLASRSW